MSILLFSRFSVQIGKYLSLTFLVNWCKSTLTRYLNPNLFPPYCRHLSICFPTIVCTQTSVSPYCLNPCICFSPIIWIQASVPPYCLIPSICLYPSICFPPTGICVPYCQTVWTLPISFPTTQPDPFEADCLNWTLPFEFPLLRLLWSRLSELWKSGFPLLTQHLISHYSDAFEADCLNSTIWFPMNHRGSNKCQSKTASKM